MDRDSLGDRYGFCVRRPVATARWSIQPGSAERVPTQDSELLTQHTDIENEVMYPRVRALLPHLKDDVLES